MVSTSGDDTSSDSHIRGELGSADPFRRAKATLQLGRHADPAALDQLLALLDDPHWPVVKAALKALRRYRDPRIVPAVQAILRRENYFSWVYSRGIAIAGVATRALRSQGEEGFQALLTLLREAKDEEVRGTIIIRQLKVLRDTRAIEPLIAALRDDDEDVRVAAIFALGDLKDPRAVEPLLAVLHDTSSEVRRRAIDVLASIDDDRAFDAVERFVRESGEGEEGDKATSALLMPLALYHKERALPLLRELVLGNTSHSHKYLSAIYALIWLGAPSVSVLLEVGRDPRPERRHTAIEWLKSAYRHSHDPRIVDFLAEIVQENHTSDGGAVRMRYHAALALAECGDPRAIRPLLEILQNAASNHLMRDAAVRQLGKLGDERTLAALAAIYEESKAWEDELEDDERPGRRSDFYGFQDALLIAISKIRARLDAAGFGEDPSSSSAAT
jgi:HEAT repeat protein